MNHTQDNECSEVIIPNEYDPASENMDFSPSADPNPPFIDLSHFIDYYKTSENEETDASGNTGSPPSHSWEAIVRSHYPEYYQTSDFDMENKADCTEPAQSIEDPSIHLNTQAPVIPEHEYKNFINYLPDFSDFQDESYSFWNNSMQEAIEEEICVYSPCSHGNENMTTLSPMAVNKETFSEKQKPDNTSKRKADELDLCAEDQLPGFQTIRTRLRSSVKEFQHETSEFTVTDSGDWSSLSPMPASYLSSVFDTPASMVTDDNESCSQPLEMDYGNLSSWVIAPNQDLLPCEISTPETRTDCDFFSSFQPTKVTTNSTTAHLNFRKDAVQGISTVLCSQSVSSFPKQDAQTKALLGSEEPEYYLLTAGGEKYLIVANSKDKNHCIPTNLNLLTPPNSSDKHTIATLPKSPDRSFGKVIHKKTGLSSVSLTPPTLNIVSEHTSTIASNSETKYVLSPITLVLTPSVKSGSGGPSLVLPKTTSHQTLPSSEFSKSHNKPIAKKPELSSPLKLSSKRDHHRPMTVKELLKEKRKRKAIETIARRCLANKGMRGITCPIKSVRPVFSDFPKKPSILVLHPDARLNQKDSISTPQSNSGNIQNGVPAFAQKVEVPTDPTEDMLSCYSDVDDPPEEPFYSSDVDDPPAAPNTLCSVSDIAGLPPFRLGRVDAKEYRPKHYDLLQLDIGTFRLAEHKDSDGKLISKFKVLFTKRQFVYEFSASAVSDGNSPQKMACIVVPFNTVSAIHCDDDVVHMRVNCQPQAFLGSRQHRVGVVASINVFDTSQVIDITQGEAARCRNHKLLLRKQQADKLKVNICNFDPRFRVVTMIPIPKDDEEDYLIDKTEPFLPSLEKRTAQKKLKKGPKHTLRKLPQLSPEPVFQGLQVCSCRVSCSSLRCSCAKAAKKCNMGRSICVCSDCDNPLNIIESIGIDPDLAVQDVCLFQNMYQVNNFRQYLNKELKMPCCNFVATLQECIPFRVLCPNTDCSEAVEYSWCRGVLCCADRNPRNHCAICGKCCFSLGKHCQKCNTCYTTKPKCTGCPNCSGGTIKNQMPTNLELGSVHNVATRETDFSTSSASNLPVLGIKIVSTGPGTEGDKGGICPWTRIE